MERAFNPVRNFGGIAFDHPQLSWEGFFEFGQRREAAAVHFDCSDERPGAKQRSGKSTWSWADFEHLLALQLAGKLGDSIEQLLIEKEILAQRLGRLQAVAGDDFA